MLLKQLSTVKLHGALTLDVKFNDEITLLVGINGSGKTSVLNAIDVLLKPDMRKLAVLNYERLALKFEEKDTHYDLVATKTDSLVTFSISGTTIPLKPITINLHKHIDPDDDEATERYSGLGPEEHERPMWDLLKSFSKPTVISLDRTLSAESEDDQFVETLRYRAQRRINARQPLTYVQDVTSEKYAEYRSKAIANDDELKAQIVMSALQDPEMFLDRKNFKPMTRTEIANLEAKVVTYLSRTIKSGHVAKQVKSFFHSARLVSERRKLAKDEQILLLDFMGSRYRQVENLAKAFDDYETKNAVVFAQLRNYLVTVNKFFNDSNKELYFDESTGKLVFSFIKSDGERTVPCRGITHLSSGERQILILFTFLAFVSNPKAVFIVDEPELSLHPKWQYEFMDAFLTLRPPDTQLLVATHSPDIVGKFKTSCVTLRGRAA